MGSVELVGRVLVSLVVVLTVVWFLGRKFRKTGKGKGVGLIDVLGRQQLSRTASVAVVRIGSQALVVGITDTQISLLGETDLVAAMAEVSVPIAPARPVEAPVRRSIPSVPQPPRANANARGPLAGSALSPATWRQAIESLRDLTAH